MRSVVFYDEKGNITEEYTHNSNDVKDWDRLYEYHANGEVKKTTETYYNEDGSRSYYTVNLYDEKGSLISSDTYSADVA